MGEQSKATTSIGGWGIYCWDCCSHRLFFSQRNMVRFKWRNVLLRFVNMKFLKEIQLQLKFVGRHDKKATFLRHFPDKPQEQDGATHDKEGPSPSALCNKSNGRCDIKAEKREELESKSSHKSDIWLPAASKK